MSVSRRLPVTLRYEYSALSAGWEQLHDAGLTLILVRVLLLVFLFLGSRGSPLPSSLFPLPSPLLPQVEQIRKKDQHFYQVWVG